VLQERQTPLSVFFVRYLRLQTVEPAKLLARLNFQLRKNFHLEARARKVLKLKYVVPWLLV
jgi:hypothetical protein